MLVGCVASGTQQPAASQKSAVPILEPILEGLIDGTPIWDTQLATANAVLIRESRYVVKAGDSLSAIGERTQVGAEAIARANNLTAPFRLLPGQVLRVPAGRYHRVSAGETGIAIARAYGIRWRDMVAANALVEPFSLRIGQRLRLPTTTAQTAEARAAAFRIDVDDLETGSAPAQTTIPSMLSTRFAGLFSWPLKGAINERFGAAGKGRVNRGIEIAGQAGAEIGAAADGSVAFVGNGGSAGYGGLVLVRHGDGWISVYGRMAQAVVTTGQAVKAGQSVGRIGEGAQLHFELRKDRVPVDPLKYLPAR